MIGSDYLFSSGKISSYRNFSLFINNLEIISIHNSRDYNIHSYLYARETDDGTWLFSDRK